MSNDGKALALAYRFVDKRERTVAEMRARLERDELPEADIEGAISELVEFGFLDDRRYARVFAEDRRTLDAWGNERIARGLRERGIDRDLIDQALVEDSADQGLAGDAGLIVSSELDRAVTLLSKRFPMGPAGPRERERAFGVLVRKGYESETAADAVRAWTRHTVV